MKISARLLGALAKSRGLLQAYEGGSVTLQRMKDHYGVITMQNKGKLNAFSGKMMVDFDDVVSDLEKDPPRGVILRGDGGVFCTGFDLNFVQRVAAQDHGEMLCLFMQSVTHRLRALPCPSVALVDGFAVGGGAELAVTCDWRALTPGAQLEFRQARIGVTTGWGGGPRLVQLVGRSRALRLLLAGSRVGLEDAAALGLADFAVPEGSEDSVSAVAEWLTAMYGDVETEAVQGLKTLVDSLSSDKDCLEKERSVFKGLWGGEVQQRVLRKARAKKEKK